MIALCQPFCSIGAAHAHLDSLMVRAFAGAFPDERIAYITDPVSGTAVRTHVPEMPTNVEPLELCAPQEDTRRVKLRLRLLRNMKTCRHAALQLGARIAVYLAFETDTCALHVSSGTRPREFYVVHNNLQRAGRQPGRLRLLRWIGGRADGLVFLEDAIREAAVQRGLVRRERSRVIPFPVEPPVHCRASLENRAVRTAVFAGTLRIDKGVDILTRAAAIFHTRWPEARSRLAIRIIGPHLSGSRPSQSSECYQYDDRRLSDEELDRVLLEADFVVVPCHRDWYEYVTPGSLYRALGCGTPVITSSLAATRTLLEGAAPVGLGFRDVEDLADRLAQAACMDGSQYEALMRNVSLVAMNRGLGNTASRVEAELGADVRG